jgi:uncharacterized protein (TIGR02266 family)
MSEPRKDKRSPTEFAVRLKSASIGDFVDCAARDISLGGLFVRSDEPMDPGTLLRIEFHVEGGSPLCHGVGRVVWVRAKEQASEPRPAGMGVKFVRMDAASKRLLGEFIAARGESGGFLDQGPEARDPAHDTSPKRKSTIPPRPSVPNLGALSAMVGSAPLPGLEREEPAAKEPSATWADEGPAPSGEATTEDVATPDALDPTAVDASPTPAVDASPTDDSPAVEASPTDDSPADASPTDDPSPADASPTDDASPAEPTPAEPTPARTGSAPRAARPEPAPRAARANSAKTRRKKKGKSKKERKQEARAKRTAKRESAPAEVVAEAVAAASESPISDPETTPKPAAERLDKPKPASTPKAREKTPRVLPTVEPQRRGAFVPLLIAFVVLCAITAAVVLGDWGSDDDRDEPTEQSP